jgi:hypothetical protein
MPDGNEMCPFGDRQKDTAAKMVIIKQTIRQSPYETSPDHSKEHPMAPTISIAKSVWKRPSRILTLVASMLLSWHAATGVTIGQEDDMDLMEEVAQLERDLADPVQEKRDAAEQRLIAMGSKALDWISPVDESMSSDQRDRIRKIRRELERQIAVELSQPSSITLKGEKSFAAILAEIKKQTGNTVRFEGDNIPEGTRSCKQPPFGMP